MIYIKLGDTSIVKVGKMKIKLGTAIFLKPQKDISKQYEPVLRRLIQENHRFVVVAHAGPKSQCIAVCLLSTSKYMNEEQRHGIKLEGNYKEYGNGKDVYMDCNDIWIIKTNCIDKIAYNLDKDDVHRVYTDCIFYNENFSIKNCFNEEDGIMKLYYPEYEFYFKQKQEHIILSEEVLDKASDRAIEIGYKNCLKILENFEILMKESAKLGYTGPLTDVNKIINSIESIEDKKNLIKAMADIKSSNEFTEIADILRRNY